VSTLVNPRLVDDVRKYGGFEASACMSCGACTAICPMGVQPRSLFRHVLLGLEDKVLEETEVIYSCLLCKMCEEYCCCGPDTRITENVRSLREYLNRRSFGIGEGL
jgi:heterodisulfide reductase subunit C2